MIERKYQKLSIEKIKENLKDLNGWKINDGKLYKEYIFENFVKAIDFIVKLSRYAEKLDHHPEIFNIYNKVTIKLSTHDIQGISEYDFKLAKMIENIK